MLMAYLTLVSGLLISAVAIFYSVAGLTSIFSAAVWPIIIMGTTLEVAKLVATVWIKQNWDIAPRFLKTYLLGAVVVLMFITSMGIFGFLSKAHSDQTLVSGDIGSKIAIYDEKIKTAKDNIEADRKQLKQMDEAVDQIMARSSDEKGADKANAVRRSQQRDRQALAKDIEANQKTISQLNDEAAPIRAENRKVEAEVGPIKYIAAFVYGANPDANILEKAVTWVIILIVVVFDPLAVMLLLASQYSFARLTKKEELKYEQDDGPLTDEQINQIRKMAKNDLPTGEVITKETLFSNIEEDIDAINLEFTNAKEEPLVSYQILEDADDDYEEYPYRNMGISPAMPLGTQYQQPTVELEPEEVEEEEFIILPPHETGTDDPIDFPVTENPTFTHTADGMVIGWVDGSVQEISVTQNPWAMDERPGDYVETAEVPTYVQNEEQQESDTWTKIVNKTITEEEYLKAVELKKKGD